MTTNPFPIPPIEPTGPGSEPDMPPDLVDPVPDDDPIPEEDPDEQLPHD